MTDDKPRASGQPSCARRDLRPSRSGLPTTRFPFGGALAVVLALVVVGVLSLALPMVTLAQEPMRLQDQVTDLTRNQVLASAQSRINAALADLRRSRNVQLFVLFVETTGSRTVTEYADDVAQRSSLGGYDALLVVAVQDRSDALWRGGQLRDSLTDRELEAILSNRVEPLLTQGDFAGAVAAGTQRLADGIAGDVSGTGSTGLGGSGLGLTPILLVLGVGAGGLWFWRKRSTGRTESTSAEAAAQQTEQRAQAANQLLIRADEALRDADQEIAFAEAQSGPAEVGLLRAHRGDRTRTVRNRRGCCPHLGTVRASPMQFDTCHSTHRCRTEGGVSCPRTSADSRSRSEIEHGPGRR